MSFNPNNVPEADVSPQKRLCLTARLPGSDVTHDTDYSFIDTVDATPGRPMSREIGYGITDVWDDMVGDMEERAPTTLKELSQRVTDLAVALARDTHEIDRRYHLHTATLKSEARYARHAWSQAMDCNKVVHAELLAYRAEVRALHEHINVLRDKGLRTMTD
ncbi:hypothetical protein Tco_1075126 [Tanacetum coccineum]